ncbi:MAG TPA: hypothetical protein DDW81_15820 [Cryomorphaceae bacterium]|nr:hypothetical protein [Cryomorphaceae bacterium]|tara:strand:- start:781 stop:1128 length:348 start_codon:yes stop_codon:yes gene_type:complete
MDQPMHQKPLKLKIMSYQYQITSYELTIETSPYNSQKTVANLTAPLGNTGRTLNVQFFDLPYDQVPGNNVYVSDFNVRMPVQALAPLVSLLQSATPVGFNFDMNTYQAQFGYSGT